MIYFSSDHHFWHNNVIKYCDRPFASVEEMNEIMILRWNEVVKPEDTVYYLGDFAMAARAPEVYTNRLNGTKILVNGNHDFTHPYHKKSRNEDNRKIWRDKYISWGWHSVVDEVNIEIDGIKLKMCHLPYPSTYENQEEAQHEDKYARFRPVDEGVILLNGHVHEKWAMKKSSKGTLMINVGVDVNNFYPISFEKIKEIIQESDKK